MFKKISVLVLLTSLFVLGGCSINTGGTTTDSAKQIQELQDKITISNEQIKTLQDKITDLEAQLPASPTTPSTTTPDTTQPATPAKNAVYTGPNFIKLSSPANEASFTEQPVVFKGTVSPNTTKIVVTAKMSFPVGDDPPAEDIYKLQNFKYGDTTFKYSAAEKYNNMICGSNNYTFIAYFDDGTTKETKIVVYYTDPSMAEMGKPVIYLYPEKQTKVSVNVEPTNGVSLSVPTKNNGWNVVANPDGSLLNLADNKTYPYLFWEGYAANFNTSKEGFVIAKNDVSKFFDEKLSYLGLNTKEISDFKEFWMPKLNEKPYYFITFVPQSDFDSYAPLTVNPSPNTVIRVFFDYKGLDSYVKVPAQTLAKNERKGFTLIEWGGRLY